MPGVALKIYAAGLGGLFAGLPYSPLDTWPSLACFLAAGGVALLWWRYREIKEREAAARLPALREEA